MAFQALIIGDHFRCGLEHRRLGLGRPGLGRFVFGRFDLGDFVLSGIVLRGDGSGGPSQQAEDGESAGDEKEGVVHRSGSYGREAKAFGGRDQATASQGMLAGLPTAEVMILGVSGKSGNGKMAAIASDAQ